MFLKKTIALLPLLFTLAAHAAEKHILIAPHCLLSSTHADYIVITKSAKLALIETNDLDSFVAAKHASREKMCGGFFDVTEEWNASTREAKTFLKVYETPATQKISALKFTIQYPDEVHSLLNQINPEELWMDLRAFSDTHADQFPDRFPNSPSGIKAAVWLQDKIRKIANDNHRDDVLIYTITTPEYKQPSVVVKIGHSQEAGIVIGAHMDTLKYTVFTGVKPGADDDGSGSMTIMSIARTLLQSGMYFKNPIYIIWYAAEERGLKGSQAVVQYFASKKIPIKAVLQYDMTGYAFQNDPAMWLVTDFVHPELTTFLSNLITTYVKQTVHTTRCGYACSDHAAWNKAGFPSAFPFEAAFDRHNPTIHTSADVIGHLSSSHMTDYLKLGLAFAVELAEPSGLSFDQQGE